MEPPHNSQRFDINININYYTPLAALAAYISIRRTEIIAPHQ